MAGQNLGLEDGDVYYLFLSPGQEGRSGDINIEREEESKKIQPPIFSGQQDD